MRQLLLLYLGLLCACASTSPTPRVAAPPVEYPPATGWHACRATLNWPDASEPDFSLDVLLAAAVYAPILERFGDELEFWRFHRRAVRDAAGHRFSFIFRADGATAGQISRAVHDNVYLQWALHDGLVETLDCADGGAWSGVALGASSDPAWPESLQRAWPHFIQGSSRLWLELIQAEMPVLAPDASLEDAQQAAVEARRRVNAIWMHDGRHALLHHLNAIFGYHPLLMRY